MVEKMGKKEKVAKGGIFIMQYFINFFLNCAKIEKYYMN